MDIRATLSGATVVDEKPIAAYYATIEGPEAKLTFGIRRIDVDVCEFNKELVRADQAKFEDAAFELRKKLREVIA